MYIKVNIYFAIYRIRNHFQDPKDLKGVKFYNKVNYFYLQKVLPVHVLLNTVEGRLGKPTCETNRILSVLWLSCFSSRGRM